MTSLSGNTISSQLCVVVFFFITSKKYLLCLVQICPENPPYDISISILRQWHNGSKRQDDFVGLIFLASLVLLRVIKMSETSRLTAERLSPDALLCNVWIQTATAARWSTFHNFSPSGGKLKCTQGPTASSLGSFTLHTFNAEMKWTCSFWGLKTRLSRLQTRWHPAVSFRRRNSSSHTPAVIHPLWTLFTNTPHSLFIYSQCCLCVFFFSRSSLHFDCFSF